MVHPCKWRHALTPLTIDINFVATERDAMWSSLTLKTDPFGSFKMKLLHDVLLPLVGHAMICMVHC